MEEIPGIVIAGVSGRMGRMLVAEMEELGLENVSQDKNGIVMGTIPGNVKAPTIAWLAHMDTSPEASGKNVKPTLHKNYNGKDIVLPGDKDYPGAKT